MLGAAPLPCLPPVSQSRAGNVYRPACHVLVCLYTLLFPSHYTILLLYALPQYCTSTAPIYITSTLDLHYPCTHYHFLNTAPITSTSILHPYRYCTYYPNTRPSLPLPPVKVSTPTLPSLLLKHNASSSQPLPPTAPRHIKPFGPPPPLQPPVHNVPVLSTLRHDSSG